MLKWETGSHGRLCADTVKEWLHAQGVDLVGIAGARDLILGYPPRPATALLPMANKEMLWWSLARPPSQMWTTASNACGSVPWAMPGKISVPGPFSCSDQAAPEPDPEQMHPALNQLIHGASMDSANGVAGRFLFNNLCCNLLEIIIPGRSTYL